MYLNRDKIISGIHDIEKITILRRLMDQIDIAGKRDGVQYSDFFDPYEQTLAENILSQVPEISWKALGEEMALERRIYGISSGYNDPNPEDAILVVKIYGKFIHLEHRNILGTLLGAGIAREKIGDIVIPSSEEAYIITRKEVGLFLYENVNRIGKSPVRTSFIELNDFPIMEDQYSFESTTSSSMRLDAIVASLTNSSRSKAKNMIEHGYVKVDFKTICSPHYEVSSSLISVRNFGRYKIYDEISMTKKGKYRFHFGKLM